MVSETCALLACIWPRTRGPSATSRQSIFVALASGAYCPVLAFVFIRVSPQGVMFRIAKGILSCDSGGLWVIHGRNGSQGFQLAGNFLPGFRVLHGRILFCRVGVVRENILPQVRWNRFARNSL